MQNSYKVKSLNFNKFDLRVIATGTFNRAKFFVASIRRLYPHKKTDIFFIIFDIVPIYTINKNQGIFMKTQLQNYDDLHFLLVLGEAAEQIKRRWIRSTNKRFFVTSFTKDHIYRSYYKEKKEYRCITMVTGDTVMISDNVSEIDYKDPPYNIPMNQLQIPLGLLSILKHKKSNVKVIEIDRKQWRSPWLGGYIKYKTHAELTDAANKILYQKVKEVFQYLTKDNRDIGCSITNTEESDVKDLLLKFINDSMLNDPKNINCCPTDKRKESPTVEKKPKILVHCPNTSKSFNQGRERSPPVILDTLSNKQPKCNIKPLTQFQSQGIYDPEFKMIYNAVLRNKNSSTDM